jgi:hypothetical protein
MVLIATVFKNQVTVYELLLKQPATMLPKRKT